MPFYEIKTVFLSASYLEKLALHVKNSRGSKGSKEGVNGSSMLCDLKADCPGGNDEKEDACSKCFTLFYLIYNRP